MNNFNNKPLTKDTVLAASKDGFLFYKHNIPQLKVNSNNKSCKSVLNPFYHDSKPSLSIYFWNNRWWFKDFGDEKYSGDVFDFAAFKYGIDPIEESELLLKTMAFIYNPNFRRLTLKNMA